MEQIRESMEWVGIVLAAMMILLLLIMLPLSLRRNRKSIDAFDDPELDELQICIPDYRLKAVIAKLDHMSWNVVPGERDEKNPGYYQTTIKRRPETDAASIKEVLHKLNRMLLLLISPLELKRVDEGNT